jgi:preprotein translocase subunit SecG
MDIWFTIVLIVDVVVALGIIGLVLLQHGKGADMGSGFGGGASSSLFGATGSANFLSRATAALATVFFLTSLGLAYLATHKQKSEGATVLDAVRSAPAKPAAEAPKPAATPAPAPEAPGSKAREVPQ